MHERHEGSQLDLAGLNWYRANFSLDRYAATQPAAMPKLRCHVLGVWSAGDHACLEQQMLASKR